MSAWSGSPEKLRRAGCRLVADSSRRLDYPSRKRPQVDSTFSSGSKLINAKRRPRHDNESSGWGERKDERRLTRRAQTVGIWPEEETAPDEGLRAARNVRTTTLRAWKRKFGGRKRAELGPGALDRTRDSSIRRPTEMVGCSLSVRQISEPPLPVSRQPLIAAEQGWSALDIANLLANPPTAFRALRSADP
jgi:hypothetical protein